MMNIHRKNGRKNKILDSIYYRKGDRRCRDRIIVGFIITLDVTINNDDLLLEFF
jgi:hypothetical protein